MAFFLILVTCCLLILAMHLHLKLRQLAQEPQIYAEVAVELQQRAHDLLVRKDQLDAQQCLESSDENNNWRNDVAQYMEDYEQEALARSRVHLGRKTPSLS